MPRSDPSLRAVGGGDENVDLERRLQAIEGDIADIRTERAVDRNDINRIDKYSFACWVLLGGACVILAGLATFIGIVKGHP